MKNLKISTSLIIAFTLLTLLIMFVAGFGVSTVKDANRSMKSIYDDRVVPLKQIKVVNDMFSSNVIDSTNKAANGIISSAEAIKTIDESMIKASEQWKAYTQTSLTAEEKAGVDTATAQLAKIQPVLGELRKALESGDKDKIAAMIKPAYAAIDPLNDVLDRLVDVQLVESKAEYDRAAATYQSTMVLFAFIAIATVIAGIAMAWWLIRAITIPLNRAKNIARNVADGEWRLVYDADWFVEAPI